MYANWELDLPCLGLFSGFLSDYHSFLLRKLICGLFFLVFLSLQLIIVEDFTDSMLIAELKHLGIV